MYPPGSTFKMAVGLAALHGRRAAAGRHIYCPGYIDLGDTRFHCWRKGGHGPLDLHGGLKHSCDVFFYEAARRAGIDAVAAMAQSFWPRHRYSGIDLPVRAHGLIPTRAWRRSIGAIGARLIPSSAGIGQGVIQATPLQLATYVSRIATGRAVVPHVARHDRRRDAARRVPRMIVRRWMCRRNGWHWCGPECSRW